jgi:hypothetical protein
MSNAPPCRPPALSPALEQEVLRALHSHLGAHGGSGEVPAALGVLCDLAALPGGALLRYAAFLTNILDYVDSYSEAHVRRAFDMFAELVLAACQQKGAGGGASQGCRCGWQGTGPSGRTGGWGRSFVSSVAAS